MIPTVENKQQEFKKIKKMRESDIYTAHLESCVLLELLHSGSVPQGKRGESEGINSSFIMWQLVYIWGFVFMPVSGLGNL